MSFSTYQIKGETYWLTNATEHSLFVYLYFFELKNTWIYTSTPPYVYMA
jgi:hypothetical protein